MKLDILAFAAHPDDVELSASGTLLKHITQKKLVGIVDLTQGELGSRGTAESREVEAEAATKIMGIHSRVNLKMRDGYFENTEENRIKIIEQIRRFQPEIVLCNALSDRHPDHGRAGKMVSEACFYSGLSKIETKWLDFKQTPWRPKAVYHYIQDRYIEPDFVVDVSDFYERKMAAIKAYKSQFFNPESNEPKTPISGEEFFDFISGRMLQFGRSIGVRYAEGFTVDRTLGVNSLFDLK